MKAKPPAARRPNSPAAAEDRQTLIHQHASYSGAIPPPELLRQFDELIPGTAAKLIAWAEQEQQHRQALEREAQAANIDAQKRQISINAYQTNAVFRGDVLGRVLGFAVWAGCAGGAIWLAFAGQVAVPIALIGMPTAAMIQAFRTNFFGRRK